MTLNVLLVFCKVMLDGASFNFQKTKKISRTLKPLMFQSQCSVQLVATIEYHHFVVHV